MTGSHRHGGTARCVHLVAQLAKITLLWCEVFVFLSVVENPSYRLHTRNERVAEANIERADDGFHAFSEENELPSKVARSHRSFPAEIAK